MEDTGANVAIHPFELAPFEHAAAAGDVEREVDDALGAFHGLVLCRHQLGGPEPAVVDAVRPVVGHAFGVGGDAVELDGHVRDLPLDHRVVRHAPTSHGHRRLLAGI